MLVYSNITSIGLYAMKIIELLKLGKIEKGSVSSHGKYTSLYSRWFRSKTKKKNEPKEKIVQASDDVYIERESIITMKYQGGKYDSI